MNKIRKGDEVIVLTGRDKGKRGTVTLRKDDSTWSSTASTWSKARQANPMKGYHRRHRRKGHADSTSPTWPSSMPLPARLIAWASRCRLTARAFACSSPAALKSRHA